MANIEDAKNLWGGLTDVGRQRGSEIITKVKQKSEESVDWIKNATKSSRSENPNETSGIAATPPLSLSYPKDGTARFKTKLVFRKYSRFADEKEATEDITATISLPLPLNVNDNYSLKTNSGDLGWKGLLNSENASSLGGLWSAYQAKGDTDFTNVGAIEQLKSGVPAATELTKRGIVQKAGLNTLAAAISKSDASQVGIFTGVIQNPHTTMMFDGVNIRQFTLDWQLSPESEEESRLLNRIFKIIKYRSHPEEFAKGYALSYPDTVEVEFVGAINDYFPKYQKSFITNISLTPISNGGITLYNTGAPVAYSFQLSLSELTIVTRRILKKQYGGGDGDI